MVEAWLQGQMTNSIVVLLFVKEQQKDIIE
jgi:hypothetical protein